MLNKFLAFVLLLWSSAAFSQTIGDYKSSFKRQGNAISFTTTEGEAKLDLCTPEMFRIRTSWTKKFEPNENLMVIKYDWQNVTAKVEEKKDQFILTTARLIIKINKIPFKVDVFNSKGKLLTSETNGSITKENTKVGVTKKLQADEHFFGFGERMDFMDRRF